MEPASYSFFILVSAYKYLFLIPLTLIQGPTVMLASGFFLRLGYFDFLPLYVTLMIGDLMGDFIWYAVGRFGAGPFLKKYGRFFSVSYETIEKLEKLFRGHQNKILFISKITTGFGFSMVTLMTAGMARVSLKNYALFNILGGFMWTALLLSLGYFFGNLYLVVAEGFQVAFLIAVITVTIAAMIGFGQYARQALFKNNNHE